MVYRLKRFVSPVFFQGSLRSKRYFEGWYFKHVSADRRSVLALIPGISLSPRGSKSFVQLIDGATGATRWFQYPLEAFEYSRDSFEVRVAGSRFSLEGISARLEDEQGVVEAHVEYSGTTPLPFTVRWPGIMGPFTYAPVMECYHGIGSLDHGVEGSITVNGRRTDFSAGRGYIEKDWGRSFPLAWIWAQTNSFSSPGTCFLFSLARIPWMGMTFPGFFTLLLEDGRTHRLATYTGAAIASARLAGRDLEVVVQGRDTRLILRAERSHEGVLLAPVQGAMDRRIGESIDARLHVRLEDLHGRAIFEGTGQSAGLEVVGDLSLIGVDAAAAGD
jgi:tocopherol cyclase